MALYTSMEFLVFSDPPAGMFSVEDSTKGDCSSWICGSYRLLEASATRSITLQKNQIDVGRVRWCWENKVVICCYS